MHICSYTVNDLNVCSAAFGGRQALAVQMYCPSEIHFLNSYPLDSDLSVG